MLNKYFKKIYFGQDLTMKESKEAMSVIMDGKATPVEIAAFLVSLHLKGETVDEIASFAEIMREKSLGLSLAEDLLDTCGTGGDQKNFFNISTATALTVASCGVMVAKHGNRAVSSSSGSADVLAELGVNISLDGEKVKSCIEEVGIGFLFAQVFHPAMKHVAPVRRELGVRTVFNILGPLSNPFHASFQILGVFDSKLIKTMVEVLKIMGLKGAMVLHSEDGLDEISVFADTHAQFFTGGNNISGMTINPKDYGLFHQDSELRKAQVSDKESAVSVFKDAVSGKNRVASDLVIINSGAALWIRGKVKEIGDGIEMAREAIASGKVESLLADYANFSNKV